MSAFAGLRWKVAASTTPTSPSGFRRRPPSARAARRTTRPGWRTALRAAGGTAPASRVPRNRGSGPADTAPVAGRVRPSPLRGTARRGRCSRRAREAAGRGVGALSSRRDHATDALRRRTGPVRPASIPGWWATPPPRRAPPAPPPGRSPTRRARPSRPGACSSRPRGPGRAPAPALRRGSSAASTTARTAFPSRKTSTRSPMAAAASAQEPASRTDPSSAWERNTMVRRSIVTIPLLSRRVITRAPCPKRRSAKPARSSSARAT